MNQNLKNNEKFLQALEIPNSDFKNDGNIFDIQKRLSIDMLQTYHGFNRFKF